MRGVELCVSCATILGATTVDDNSDVQTPQQSLTGSISATKNFLGQGQAQEEPWLTAAATPQLTVTERKTCNQFNIRQMRHIQVLPTWSKT